MTMLVALPTVYGIYPARLQARAVRMAFGFATSPSITLALPQQRARGQAGKAPREELLEHYR